MVKSVTAYDILLSCPSDIEGFLPDLEQTIYYFNRRFGCKNNIVLRPRHWSKDTYSEFGDHPETLLVEQIVKTSDIAIVVFWTRFGTPTEEFGSGTEEEIERMLKTKKQVFLFFLDKPVQPSMLDHEQYQKILAFQQRHKNDGIYFTVNDEKSLSNRLYENLELYFNSILHGAAVKKKSGQKSILWVDDHPENNVYERNILEHYGITFALALSTDQALDLMSHNSYDLVISDLGRKEGKQEGFVLLQKIREQHYTMPYIIFSAATKSEMIKETLLRGGQGCTNISPALVEMVLTQLLGSVK